MTGQEPRTVRAGLAAAGRWENEGGARPETSPVTTPLASSGAHVETPTHGTGSALDARQDELMTIASSDGRPPPRRLRMIEWRWFGVGAVLVIAGLATWIVIKGVSLGAVVAGLALGVLLLVAASPVWGAALLRGREERAARKTAQIERHESCG